MYGYVNGHDIVSGVLTRLQIYIQPRALRTFYKRGRRFVFVRRRDENNS